MTTPCILPCLNGISPCYGKMNYFLQHFVIFLFTSRIFLLSSNVRVDSGHPIKNPHKTLFINFFIIILHTQSDNIEFRPSHSNLIMPFELAKRRIIFMKEIAMRSMMFLLVGASFYLGACGSGVSNSQSASDENDGVVPQQVEIKNPSDALTESAEVRTRKTTFTLRPIEGSSLSPQRTSRLLGPLAN